MKSITLDELTSPGCYNCAEFEKFWKSVENNWPNVTFKKVSVTTSEGQALAQKHMIMTSPGIILNGELFSTGGVTQGKFLSKLKELSAE